MDLSAPGTDDNIDDITEADIYTWAKNYLPAPIAVAFAEWVDGEIADWANDSVTVYDVLKGAYDEWTGADYPNP